MQCQLRIATIQDLPAVQAVVTAAYAHYVERIGQLPGPMRDDYALLISKAHVHVLEHEGEVRGILVLIPDDDALLLDNVAVVPGAQGLGLGRTMLAFAEATARQLGYKTIKLYTHEMMTENLALCSYRISRDAPRRGKRAAAGVYG